MKKKIVFGLAIFALMFFFGGVYIVTTTQATIYELHRLSQLHYTIALRKDLLTDIKKKQSNIRIQGTLPALEAETSGNDTLMKTAAKCLACHHAPPRQERGILKRTNQRKIILFALVTIAPFFAVGLAFLLIRGLTRPVNSLLDATRRLKAGDLDYRIKGLHDEFGEVANSFNEMADSLKKQMQEMQRTEQLRISGEMAAGLAHEIRNPLAGMKVSIEVLLSELDIEERDREVLQKIIEQIRHLELLMKNLLNYARPVAAQPTHVDVNKILEKTVYFVEKHPSFISGNPRKHIIREFDQHLPEIFGDPQQLQQIFLNILLNAAEAIPEGGKITVKTCHDGNAKTVAIEICDTGKGIPAELMEKIFQPFFTTKGKGTGLGLAVSKRIVEEHGGNISVSNNVSGGVTFTITLPVKAEDQGLTL
ncbi:MAG: ATP-binding protein [Deltaproteobacteria bacterium]|nr:ATP-binding protein [Deltaproteobacteria bacterium]